jgi:hypothetical protein
MFLCLSDGDEKAPPVLLTGGFLVRIQAEEPNSPVQPIDYGE